MGFFDRFKSKTEENARPSANIILAPMSGEAKNIAECDDQVFAQNIVGKGAMIIPTEGKVYAPVDGIITMVAETGHAIGITSNSGAEILIHIGLDTVDLAGAPFDIKINQGQDVKKGDLLLEFDIEQIKANDKLTQSPIIITNPDSYEITVLKYGEVSHGDQLIEIREI